MNILFQEFGNYEKARRKMERRLDEIRRRSAVKNRTLKYRVGRVIAILMAPNIKFYCNLAFYGYFLGMLYNVVLFKPISEKLNYAEILAYCSVGGLLCEALFEVGSIY